MKAMHKMIEMYINGNISDARERAKRFSQFRISECLIEDFDYSEHKARLTAAHMKGEDCWQAACDAE